MLQHGHLRLKCGHYMYLFFFLFKVRGWGYAQVHFAVLKLRYFFWFYWEANFCFLIYRSKSTKVMNLLLGWPWICGQSSILFLLPPAIDQSVGNLVN